MSESYPEQEAAAGKFPQNKTGSSAASQQQLTKTIALNAQKLAHIQMGDNETNEGGAKPASYYNF